MKVFVLFTAAVWFLLTFCGEVSNLPELKHIECHTIPHVNSINADVCIEVDFKDGNGNDFALVSYIGLKSDQNIEGYLLIGLNQVIITGKWIEPFNNACEYLITILSPRCLTTNRFQRNQNGTTSPVFYPQQLLMMSYLT